MVNDSRRSDEIGFTGPTLNCTSESEIFLLF